MGHQNVTFTILSTQGSSASDCDFFRTTARGQVTFSGCTSAWRLHGVLVHVYIAWSSLSALQRTQRTIPQVSVSALNQDLGF